jgi:hypothetical protein
VTRKRRGPKKRRRAAPARPRAQGWSAILLDRVTVEGVRQGRQLAEEALRYHWDYFAALQHQRSRAATEINKALLGAAEGPFTLEGWQRVVDYRYSLEPLSSSGSVRSDPGGRFNIGDIDRAKFPAFPALYLASDRETALLEKFGRDDPQGELGALDFALRRATSFSNVAVSGRLESVINLEHADRLQPFVDLISTFTLPPDLAGRARRLRFEAPNLVDSVDDLIKNLTLPDWRILPMQFDVPASAQVFGQLVAAAGIEGIVYPSIKSGAPCLALFPQNLGVSSYVQLDDEPPDASVIRRLDASTWLDLV